MFAGGRKMRSIRDTSTTFLACRFASQSRDVINRTLLRSSGHGFTPPKISPRTRRIGRSKSIPERATDEMAFGFRSSRSHTNRRAGRSALRSPPDPPGVGNNHHDLECASQRSAEAIGEDPLEGRVWDSWSQCQCGSCQPRSRSLGPRSRRKQAISMVAPSLG